MKANKILLPEASTPSRNKRKKRTSSINKTKSSRRTLPFVTDSRQRSEAIGLVLIGISAFSLSLLHHLSSAKLSNIVNTFCVYLGVGVYIIPLMIGLMGIQRFLERPFKNLIARFIGSVGVLIFGLGLLGLEGGKLGVYSLGMFSKYFGNTSSKVLFVFLLMSSLIFALDILYKDILATGLVLAGLGTRLTLFIWELLISMCSMAIGAVKTTMSLFSVIAGKISQTYKESDIQPSQHLGKLLSFTRPNTTDISDNENDEDFDTDVINNNKNNVDENISNSTSRTKLSSIKDDVAEDATIIPTPQIWNSENSSDEQQAPSSFQNETNALNSSVSIQVTNLTGVSTIDAQNVSPLPSPTEEITDTAKEEEENIDIIISLEPKARKEIYQEEENNTTTAQISSDVISNEEEEEDKNKALYLDDNSIDVEIKNNEDHIHSVDNNPYSESKIPPLSILITPPPRDNRQAQSDLSLRSALLLKTLAEFNINAAISNIVEGPAVSRFEIKPAPGVKVASILRLENDIALALSATSIRIEAPIPGKPALGIEIPNNHPTPVYFYDLLKNDNFVDKKTCLNLALGVTINGKPVFANLAEMPHLLIAGSTGSGKSVCINTIIASILYQARADQVKFVMIDPKMVELSSYNGIPHLIAPVVTDPSKASAALLWAVEEMERRYELLSECKVRKISTFNSEIERLRKDIDENLETLPYIVIVIDELADLMMTASAEVEGSICRLAQMARAVGIHLIIATQRPSVNVLTGLIKANLPSRIAFSVTSVIDSRTVLDCKGAETLLGKGDMLFVPKGRNKPLRLQGAFISDRELTEITEYVKSQGKPEYMNIAPVNTDDDEDEENEDDIASSTSSADAKLLAKIEKYLETQEKTSTSMLQRKFRIGYNRAARIMDILEERGMVSPLDGSNKRRVLSGRSSS